MQLAYLELFDIRSYERAQLDFGPSTTVFVGPNAQGKTNLLEAIYRVSSGQSHRAPNDAVLVRVGADSGAIRAKLVTDDGRRRSVEIALGDRRTRTQVDGNAVRRTAESIGILRAVMFAPEDLAIVRGDPAARRGFLDQLLAQRRPAYASVRAEYERTLRQRNQLLKQARVLGSSARQTALRTLDTWTEQLVRHGSQLLAARLAGVQALQAPVDTAYRRLADRPEAVTLRYISTVDSPELTETVETETPPASLAVPDLGEIHGNFMRRIEQALADEVRRGITLVGPHRDDVDVLIGPLLARTYASHGEAWSLALALKLGGAELLASVGDRPVLLLDDVFAELDETRRDQLAGMCAEFDQVIVTAAVEADVPLEGTKLDVRLQDGRSTVSPRTVPTTALPRSTPEERDGETGA